MDKLVDTCPKSIKLTLNIWNQMLESVAKLDQIEACGLLFGSNHIVSLVIPVSNILNSPTRYKMDPQGQFHAFKIMEEKNLELIGIYHSHPDGPEYPSKTDIAEAFYPEAVYLIWFKQNHIWDCNAYCIKSGGITKTKITISK